jgi:hypothetical protein
MARPGDKFELPDDWKTNNRILLKHIEQALSSTGNIACVLPLLFRAKGAPVTLDRHFPFEICFYHNRPRRVIKRCGRQVGKSFQNGLELLIRAILLSDWNILYVTPLFEQVRRFSTQYVGPFIEESPARRLMLLKGASNQVLQRTLGTRSTIFFSYAQRDANRARGINCNEVMYDEIQLFNPDVIPVLQQTMGGSDYGEYETFAGTPLSFSNIIERLFDQSTMSEWMIKCRSCGFENIAAYNKHLMQMIGPAHDGIGPGGVDKDGHPLGRVSGLVCSRCSKSGNSNRNLKPLFPEDGRWIHRHPERRMDFLGIHVPQPIMPNHAYSFNRWVKLQNRLAAGNDFEIFNEILGEACDSSFKPISEQELRAASCLPHKNTVEDALRVRQRYTRVAMGIDWGGGGKTNVSRTKAAIVGLTPTGLSHVIYGVDLNFCHKPFEEVKFLMILAMKFGVEYIAHDVGGGVGSTRETLMYQTGSLNANLVPMSYIGPMSKSLIRYCPPSVDGEIGYWTVDKARSLTYLCQAIKQGHVQFFQYDYVSPEQPGVIHDFTALISEIQHSPRSSDILLVDREDGTSDDFAHAVNFGLLALWSQHDAFPKLNMQMATASVQELANTVNMVRDADTYSADDIETMLRQLSTSFVHGNY